jgi:hypothetical protein
LGPLLQPRLAPTPPQNAQTNSTTTALRLIAVLNTLIQRPRDRDLMQRATTQANGLAGPTTFLGLFLSVPIGDAAPGVPAQGGRYPPPNEYVPQ